MTFKNCMGNNNKTVTCPPGNLAQSKGTGVIAALFLILLLSQVHDTFGALANYNKRGLRAYTIDGVLRLDDDEIDLATAALILSRDWGTTKTSHVYRRKIDDMAEEIIRRVKDAHVPMNHRAVPVINQYLFEEMGFTTVDNADDPDDLFLHIVLERKRGYCLSLSVLYLSLAERLGLPIYGVVVPGHFFVRYDDGDIRFNIETTSFGNTATDEYYKEKFKAPRHLKSLYMKNLDKKQTLGCFFNNLGNCYLQVGNTPRAFEILNNAVRINPLLSEAHMNLGNIYLQRSQPRDAVTCYENALGILGRDGHAFNGLGLAHMQLGDYPKAESYLKTALSLDPDSIETRRNLARLLHMQGKNTAAVSELKNILKLAPGDSESLILVGQIYQQLTENNNAEYYLEKAVQAAPEDPAARCSLGYLYLDTDRGPSALEQFRYVIDHIREDANAFFGMGRVYDSQNQPDQAAWAYQRALDFAPQMVPALQNLGNAYIDTDRLAEAIDVYERAVKIEPQNGALRYNLAVALAKNNQHQQAINQFNATVDCGTMQAAAYNGMAISYYYLKDFENAGIFARKASALGYNVQQALLNLK